MLIDIESLGKSIKKMRIHRGFTKKDVCQNYISERHYIRIENGKVTPKMDTLIHISNVLHFSLEEMLVSSVVKDYYKYVQDKQVFKEYFHNGEFKRLADYENLFKRLLNKPLPLNELKTIHFTYATIQFQVHHNEEKALNIIKQIINKSIGNVTSITSKIDGSLYGMLLRLSPETELTSNLVNDIIIHKKDKNPYLAYYLNIFYYEKKNWKSMFRLSKYHIQKVNYHDSYKLLPLFYCQAGAAVFMLKHEKIGRTFFDEGIRLAKLFRQEYFCRELNQLKNEIGI
ncbi:helix-turn-helix transcriptional regulator [Bacillaceae bacterium Marseille-Q3522]|nr:helix-turn-helix transcriptional regulator [Bacillaceae bacterium Marseille-Q3522]